MEGKKECVNFSGMRQDFPINRDDKVAIKFAMILEGSCMGLGARKAAAKYGYSKQHYYQILHTYQQGGIEGLKDKKPGPKSNPGHPETKPVEKQVIRHRFLDPKASPRSVGVKRSIKAVIR